MSHNETCTYCIEKKPCHLSVVCKKLSGETVITHYCSLEHLKYSIDQAVEDKVDSNTNQQEEK